MSNVPQDQKAQGQKNDHSYQSGAAKADSTGRKDESTVKTAKEGAKNEGGASSVTDNKSSKI